MKEFSVQQRPPVGYKQTKVGVIPNDWSVFSIGELFDYLHTASNSRADLGHTGTVLYVHYGDIHTRFHHFIDFFVTKCRIFWLTKVSQLLAFVMAI